MFSSKVWLREQMLSYLSVFKTKLEGAGGVAHHGTKTSNASIDVAGNYTVDASGNAVSIGLPEATGSGDVYVITLVNTSRVNPVSIILDGNDLINGSDVTSPIITDGVITLTDAVDGMWVSSGTMQQHQVTLHVPSIHPTIQDALDACYTFQPTSGQIVIQITGDVALTYNLEYTGSTPVTIQGEGSLAYDRLWTPHNGDVGTWTGDADTDTVTANGLYGTTLDITGLNNDGLIMNNAPNVHLSRMKIVASESQNHVIYQTSGAGGSMQLDKLLCIGSRYGVRVENMSDFSMRNSVIVGTRFSGIYVRNTGFTFTKVSTITEGTGIVVDQGSSGSMFIPHIKADDYGIEVRGGSAISVNYPKIKGTNACMVGGAGSYIEMALSSSTSLYGYFEGGAIVRTYGGTFVCESNAVSLYATAITDIPVVQGNDGSNLRLGPWLSDTRFDQGSNKRAELNSGSYGRYTNPNITLAPAANVGNNNSTWN